MDSHIRRSRLCLRFLLALSLLLTACSRSNELPTSSTLRVVATIPPLLGLVKPLLPPDADAQLLIRPGYSIHGHRLTARETALARHADVVFAIGLGLEEGALEQLQAGRPQNQLFIVFEDALSREQIAATATAAAEASHAHAHGVDPHVWLDPELAERFVQYATEKLVERVGSETSLAADYRARRDAFLASIDAVDQDYRRQLAPFAGMAIMTQHPAFGRLVRRYGLEERAIKRVGEAEAPTAAELADAVNALEGKRVAAIFIEPQMPSGLAQNLAKRTGVAVGTLDPLGDGDWEKMMRANLAEIVRVLSANQTQP